MDYTEKKKTQGRRTKKGVPDFQSKGLPGGKEAPRPAGNAAAKGNAQSAPRRNPGDNRKDGAETGSRLPADLAEIRLKPYKKEFPFSYSCGVFPTCELLNARPGMLKRLIVTTDSLENAGVRKLIEGARQLGIPVSEDDKTAERLYPKENTRAIGVFTKYETPLDPASNHVVLVNPSDMGNLGTILRTMAAFELFDLAIITPAADIFDPKVIRASMGAFFRLRCSRFASFEEYLSSLKGEALPPRSFYPFMLCGETMENVRHPGGMFSLLFGNEASGLPEAFSAVGRPVRIEHAATVDSLNLPVAAAIGIYYFVKEGLRHG